MKNTMQVAIHCSLTEEFLDFLKSRNKRIIIVAYGYYNEIDLITYEV